MGYIVSTHIVEMDDRGVLIPKKVRE